MCRVEPHRLVMRPVPPENHIRAWRKLPQVQSEWTPTKELLRDVTLQTAFNFSHELGAWAFAGLAVGHAAAALFHHFVLRDEVLESMAPVIAMARPKQELATSHIVPETLSGNKCDQLAVLLTRRGNGDEPTKRHDAPDTSGISQSSL